MVSHFISYTPGKNGNASQHNHINPKLIKKKNQRVFRTGHVLFDETELCSDLASKKKAGLVLVQHGL